jgi:hypothetical protein
MSEERRKPIPSGRKGIIATEASTLPGLFNLQRSRPAVNEIQANTRKLAEKRAKSTHSKRKTPGSSVADGSSLFE